MVDVVLLVTHEEEFTELEFYHECPTSSGDPFVSAKQRQTVTSSIPLGSTDWEVSHTWAVVTGSGPGECHGGPVSFHARVHIDGDGWSAWETVEGTIADPPSSVHPTPTFRSVSPAKIRYNFSTPINDLL